MEYSDHAKERMFHFGITEDDVGIILRSTEPFFSSKDNRWRFRILSYESRINLRRELLSKSGKIDWQRFDFLKSCTVILNQEGNRVITVFKGDYSHKWRPSEGSKWKHALLTMKEAMKNSEEKAC